MTTTISMDKKYKTRGGEKVRLLAVDAKSNYPIVGLIIRADGSEDVIQLTSNGMFYDNPAITCEYDLIEELPVVEFYVIMDDYGAGYRVGACTYITKTGAREAASRRGTRTTRVVKVTYDPSTGETVCTNI